MADEIELELEPGDDDDRWVTIGVGRAARESASPRQRRWRRVGLPIAIVAVIVAAAFVGSAARDHTSTPATTAASASTTPGGRPETTASLTLPSTAASPAQTDSLEPPYDVARTVEHVAGLPLATPTGVDLVALTGSRGLLEIDVDAARVDIVPAPIGISTGQMFVVAGVDWTIVRPLDEVAGVRYIGRGGPQRLTGLLDHGTFGLYPGPDRTTVWMVQRGERTAVDQVQEVSLSGMPIGAPIPLAGGLPPVPDGAGQLLITAGGGTYVAGREGLSRLTTGGVLSIDAARALVVECDEHFDCRKILIDRKTGERRDLGAGDPVAAGLTTGVMAPDGSAASWFDPTINALRVLDIASGELRGLMHAGGLESIAWSTDGRYLFALGDNGRNGLGIVVWDRTAARRDPLGDALPAVVAVTTRPSS